MFHLTLWREGIPLSTCGEGNGHYEIYEMTIYIFFKISSEIFWIYSDTFNVVRNNKIISQKKQMWIEIFCWSTMGHIISYADIAM